MAVGRATVRESTGDEGGCGEGGGDIGGDG